MLRITTASTATEHRWTLCGRLTGPWVAELRSSWEHTRRASAGRRCLVDLTDVIFVDESAERLLQEMWNDGAEFVARGVDTRDILDNLSTRKRPALRRFLAHLEELK